jgi:hypothetical protein
MTISKAKDEMPYRPEGRAFVGNSGVDVGPQSSEAAVKSAIVSPDNNLLLPESKYLEIYPWKPYPRFLQVHLVSVGVNACPVVTATMEYAAGNPKTYSKISGGYAVLSLYRVTLPSDDITWHLSIRQIGGICNGVFSSMRRTITSDNPVGQYCVLEGDGARNCSLASAMVVDAD